ncbi:probable folate-biopterin transporter 4 isoform X5 [Fagus crenata]
MLHLLCCVLTDMVHSFFETLTETRILEPKLLKPLTCDVDSVNLGSTFGSFLGAGLASMLNISSGSFDNLVLGIANQVLCTFISIAFLFLYQKKPQGYQHIS